jgi:DNA-binding transcriptional regulator YiaG
MSNAIEEKKKRTFGPSHRGHIELLQAKRRAAISEADKASGAMEKSLKNLKKLKSEIGLGISPEKAPGKISELRQEIGISQEEFGRITGYSTRTIAAFEAGKVPRDGARRKIKEIGRLLKALSELMPPDQVGAWLREADEAFDGQTPMHLIERGEADRLWEMVHQIDANVAN